MEEKKIASKEVKLKPVVNSQENAQNPEGTLIEELQKWDKDKLIQQVMQMNRQLYNQGNYVERLRGQISEMQNYFSNKRMEYLFEVVKIASQAKDDSCYACFAKEFVEDCINEIQESLTIPEQAEQPDNKEN